MTKVIAIQDRTVAMLKKPRVTENATAFIRVLLDASEMKSASTAVNATTSVVTAVLLNRADLAVCIAKMSDAKRTTSRKSTAASAGGISVSAAAVRSQVPTAGMTAVPGAPAEVDVVLKPGVMGSYMSKRYAEMVATNTLPQAGLICGDCYFVNHLRPTDAIRCRECGYRIMFKQRVRRPIEYSAQ